MFHLPVKFKVGKTKLYIWVTYMGGKTINKSKGIIITKVRIVVTGGSKGCTMGEEYTPRAV